MTTEAPIVAPTNVTAQLLPSGNVLISWDANTQTHLKGYNVYRLDTENFQIGKLNTSVLAQNNYIDRSPERNVPYEYRVTSVSVKDAESGYSAVVIVIPPDNATKKDPKRNED